MLRNQQKLRSTPYDGLIQLIMDKAVAEILDFFWEEKQV
jgi:hypothetical protein